MSNRVEVVQSEGYLPVTEEIARASRVFDVEQSTVHIRPNVVAIW